MRHRLARLGSPIYANKRCPHAPMRPEIGEYMGIETANLGEVYPLVPFRSVRGLGVYLEDGSGRRVMDLYGGHAVAALGYAHPRLTEVIGRQAKALQFQSNIVALKVRDEAAERLAAFAPEPL